MDGLNSGGGRRRGKRNHAVTAGEASSSLQETLLWRRNRPGPPASQPNPASRGDEKRFDDAPNFRAEPSMKTVLSQSEIWQIAAVSFHTETYRATYMEALDFVLRDKGLSILDTAGGTGFPTLDLYERGYQDISVTDGDERLAVALQERFDAHQIKISAVHSRWHELATKIERKFDAVLNVDNSFVYIDGWLGGDVAEGKDAVVERLRIGLENFFAVTKAGGFTVIGLG